jgi:AGCS family alanine or glycine:cation symporter
MTEVITGVALVSDFLWGGAWGDTQVLPLGIVTAVLLGSGAFFMVRLRFRPLRRLMPAFATLWRGRRAEGAGEITPWQAVSTALSGQIGTGNLAGVATAITLGGPGAVFWMWVTAILGMAIAFAESSLAVRFRATEPGGGLRGGPMYYIRDGLGPAWRWLALVFCAGTLISSLVTGNMIQANSVAQSVIEVGRGVGLEVPAWAAGIVVAFLAFLVIVRGIEGIGAVAGRLVPLMAVGYVATAVAALALHGGLVGDAVALIVRSAFGVEQAAGGVAGYGVVAAIRAGVARALFSTEAGQGSAPIAHAAAQTDSPVRQGEIAMIGVFIDTLIVCTMTALVILTVDGAYPTEEGTALVSHAWRSTDLHASAITTAVFAQALPGGQWVVLGAQFLFAFTTILGWSFYGEQAAHFLFGPRATAAWRSVTVACVLLGAWTADVESLWRLGDIANTTMLIPNIIAVIALSNIVVAMTAGPASESGGRGDRRREV